MNKKRRMFEIDLPEDSSLPETFPAGKVSPRRGPMASAIAETAESLAERREIEAEIRAENDALAHEHVRLKRLGLIVDLVPLEAIRTSKLVRDRIKTLDPDLAELKASIAEIGLSNPIRIEAAGEGIYELVQGSRRLQAYRELLEETGDPERYGRIPAGILMPGETTEDLYRRMIDENMVRKDISFAEMALTAIGYAGDPGTSERDPDKAVALLFKSASYQKRSYIRSFVRLMERFETVLIYPQEIPRSLGLQLLARMEEDDTVFRRIVAELKGWENRSITDELDVLRRFAGAGAGEGEGASAPKKAPKPRKARTTFDIPRPGGAAKCTASAGRLEIRLARDFSELDRRQLEAAVNALLDRIG